MYLSVEQHLGYYHQSVPALPGDELFGVMLQTVWKDFCGDSCEYKFHSYFSFTLIYSILPFCLPHISISLPCSFDSPIACLCYFFFLSFFISLHFQGMNCSPLSLGSRQEFIFSGSNVSECHFWQEPTTATMNTRTDTVCYCLIAPCLYLYPCNVLHIVPQYKQECW